MATASACSPPTLPLSSASPSEESQTNDGEAPQQEVQKETREEFMYKTKTIQFLGRTTPIILQNENGPCPLLAICNVLLLRNNLNLNPDSSEVSQEKLLSLVAERLIDSNSNVDNKDKGYAENQQQNIADAIDRLPHLATGIDVNIRFRRIDDFEFTPECAIFDLLDIPLYHGWIVDPQDVKTNNAIGSKSYNALMGELVALETQNVEVCHDQNPGEDSVDFVAATTAALGVPSPSLSKTRSFDDSPPENRKLRKEGLQEEAELLKAMELSEREVPASALDTLVDATNGGSASVYSDQNQLSDEDLLVNPEDNVEAQTSTHHGNISQPEESKPDDNKTLNNGENTINTEEEVCSTLSTTKSNGVVDCDRSSSKESGEPTVCDGGIEKSSKQTYADETASSEMPCVENINLETTTIDGCSGFLHTAVEATSVIPAEHPRSSGRINLMDITRDGKPVNNQSTSTISIPEQDESIPRDVRADVSGSSLITIPHDSCVRSQHDAVPGVFTSSVGTAEPIYEGEECVNSGAVLCADNEPVYEGEAVLATKAEKNAADDSSQGRATDSLTPEEGYLIRNFLKYSASQLTFCGLFLLQEGLKERELCVFFRNNHFSTMFKYEGELYLLATDQGYLNQADLVWEKLNEVNGDTLFMTGNFKIFKVDSSNTNAMWDEQNSVTSTADYLASINTATEAGRDINSDLQLAIALQQQEFEQQSPRSSTPPQQPASNFSRLVTGPQVPRSSHRPSSATSSSKPEGKPSKEKCTVM